MASRNGMLYTSPISQEYSYYPLLIGGLEGMNICGIDEDFEYKDKTLSVKNVLVENINGNAPITRNDILSNNLFSKLNYHQLGLLMEIERIQLANPFGRII